MWAYHFESLCTPSDNVTYIRVSFRKFLVELKNCFNFFTESRNLSEQISYEEVCNICNKLKQGVTGIPYILRLLGLIYGFTFLSFATGIFPNAERVAP